MDLGGYVFSWFTETVVLHMCILILCVNVHEKVSMQLAVPMCAPSIHVLYLLRFLFF